jgi:hypothetical protein
MAMCEIYVMFADENLSMTLAKDNDLINAHITVLNGAFENIKTKEEALDLSIRKYTMFHSFLLDVRVQLKDRGLLLDYMDYPTGNSCALCKYNRSECSECVIGEYSDDDCTGTAWEDLYDTILDLNDVDVDISQDELLGIAIGHCMDELKFLKFIKEAEYEGVLE